MLKNEILKLTELRNNPKYFKVPLEKEKDIYSFLEKLPTIQKIFIAQNLLKEMRSIKDLFSDNKNSMIKRIDANSYKYYRNSLLIKQIYDYCDSNNPECMTNYILLKGKEADDALHGFEETQKHFIEKFFFELRNNNNLMLKIIQEIDIKYYDQLGCFLTHFLYENTASSNFNQDELILMLYLIMEDTIDNKFPQNFSQEFLVELTSEKFKYFLYFFLKHFTKKAEIRNFLTNILHDLILDLENQNQKLTVNINTIIGISINHDDDRRKTMLTPKKESADFDLLKQINNNKIQKNELKYSMRTKSVVPQNFDFINLNEKINKKDIFFKFNSNNDLEVEDYDDIDIFGFFEENNFTRIDLSKILADLNKKNDRTEIENAFMEFLLFLKNEFHKENKEIFSSGMILQSLMDEKEKKKIISEEKEQKINEMYVKNFTIIINFIINLFEKIIQSLNSLPYTIKCVFFFLDKLISKKYKKNNITYYQSLILKLKIFFDSFILPVLRNPISNGCISDGVLSNITLENLKLISTVVEKFISGNLFKIFNDVSDPYMTIFNKFLVKQIPNFFDIAIEIDKNIKNKFEPPNVVMQLIELKELNIITDKNKRNINYDFFLFNQKENIQYQSVCFSYSDLLMFIRTIIDKKLENYCETKTLMKSDFERIRTYQKHFNDRYNEGISENKIEFLFISKLNYKESFLNEIKAVTEDHFENYFNSQRNNSEIPEDILLFKKCLIELIIHINKINKENFISFIRNKDELILEHNSIINKYYKQREYINYKNISFENDKDNKKIKEKNNNNFINNSLENDLMKSCLSCDLMEDADFLEEIFPRIINIVKSELGNTLDYNKYERVFFCITYLQINIKHLPPQCSANNYSNLFIDIIEDIQNLINSLQNNILNQFYLKIREGDKLNLIFSKYSSEIKSMEKFYTINYLFNKVTPNNPLEETDSSPIQKEKTMKTIHNTPSLEPKTNPKSPIPGKSISFFIKNFFDFRKHYDDIIDDIILKEKEEGTPDMLKKYFKEINNLVKTEEIMTKYQTNDFISICYDLENYILLKLYKKIFPINQSKSDEFIYNKCQRLNFIKPENIIADKKMINENLLLKATEYINNIDKKYTPVDKINMFGKAFQILQNSMTFSSGKSDLGIDDTLPLLIYVMIKAKPRMINSNYIFCKNYINPELDKKEHGFLLMQIGVVIRIICDMKYTELKDVTEEQFGVDEELPPGLIDNKKKDNDKTNNEINS